MDSAPHPTSLASHVGEEDDITNLADLTDTNRENLLQNENDFQPHTWEQLKEIVGARQFQQLQRYPPELRRYMRWSSQIKREYGNLSNFVCRERLHWSSLSDPSTSLKPSDIVPFGHPDDYKILRNDWPYAVPSDVVHLIVWLKTPLDSLPDGNLSARGRAQVQEFVNACFISPIKAKQGSGDGDDTVLWFKNWSALQTVGALEHFHCLVRGADEDLLREWTGGG